MTKAWKVIEKAKKHHTLSGFLASPSSLHLCRKVSRPSGGQLVTSVKRLICAGRTNRICDGLGGRCPMFISTPSCRRWGVSTLEVKDKNERISKNRWAIPDQLELDVDVLPDLNPGART